MNGDFYVGRIYGISIIPDENIPPGYKRTEESNIFINEHNYDLMKTLSAKGMIIALGTLREVQQKEP